MEPARFQRRCTLGALLSKARSDGSRMQPAIMKLMTGALLLVCLSAAGSTAGADVLFDDHFTGNSGGIPAGWIFGGGTGSAVEAGTTLTFTGEIAIGTGSTLDPNKGTDTLTISIAATGSRVAYLSTGFAASDLTHMLLLRFRPFGPALEISASDTGGETWQTYSLTYLWGYAFGPLTLTLVLGPNEFCVSSDSPAYSSGFIAYSTAFPAFTRSDLGHACHLALTHGGDPAGQWTSSIDRLRLATDSPTPVRSHTFGQLKARYR
jgi:hypothetical protein